MAVRIKIHGGDLPPSTQLNITLGQVSPTTGLIAGTGERIALTSETVAELSVATEENVKRIGGTVGWGAAGVVLRGPVGLLAGLLAGGGKKETTFFLLSRMGAKCSPRWTPRQMSKW